jgi:hypothetical protein
MGAKRGSLHERFWRHVTKTDGCWLWTGSTDTSGYGQIRESFAGRLLRVTRVALEVQGVYVPPGAVVCHSCDVRRCVRPDHLWVGTSRANALDCIAKGRFPFVGTNDKWHTARPRGESHRRAKLTEAVVRQIRAEYRPVYGGPTQQPTSMRGLAAKYGISKTVVQQILSGKIWQHIM